EDLSGSAAGVFKMSSMLGGALGVAILTGLARALTERDAAGPMARSGLSSDEVTEAHRALVNSSDFKQAIASLPADQRSKVSDVVTEAFSSGVANSMVVTAVMAVAASIAVLFLWPRRSRQASRTGKVTRDTTG